MAIKTHLADSDSPLKEGSKLLAICGELVTDVAFLSEWNDGMMIGPRQLFSNLFGVCRKCLNAKLTHRYLYACRNGEEALHDGSVIDKAVEQVILAEKRSQQ